MKNQYPCRLDNNGECTVCDTSLEYCGYDRMINKDYRYESKEELKEMFKEYIK